MKTTDEPKSDTHSQADTDVGAAPPEAEIDEAWERPVAVAKDRNVRAWLFFLGLICFGVALWTPLRSLYYRYGYAKSEVVVKRDADTFVAIAYYGVNSDVPAGSQDISTTVFAEQLRLLRLRGYEPITLQDVRAFYKEGKLLPRKAVLMTFEQSRKSSYFEIRNLLHEYKWKAVMGVNTAPVHAKDAQALLWPYFRDMITMGSWELAAQSEHGFDAIETSPSGHTGPFFSNPQWLADNRRYELPEEFNKRIEKDHQNVIREFEKEVGSKPIAFFFPYGDYGQYEEQAKVVRVTNMHQVGALYELGFTLGQLALNTRSSDPRRLNRLLVNPAWNARQFISKLDSFWPIEPMRGVNSKGYDADRWIGEWGEVFVREKELVLRAIPPVNPVMTLRQAPASSTAGAKAWLAGSDTFEDGFFSVRFQLKRGRFGVYLRSTSVGHYVYFSLDDAGKVSVRQRLPDMDELMLATDTLPGDGTSNHELLICLRDNLFFARLNGKTLFGGRVLLNGENRPGLAAVGIWDPIPGIAEAVVLDTRLVSRRDALVTWTPDVAKDPGYLTSWLNEHGYQFNVLSPPWLDIYENSPITFPIWDRQALKLLARTNNMRIMPHVQIRDASQLLKVPISEIIERALEHDVQGLYVDASSCTPEQVTSLVTWLVRLHQAMLEKNLSLALKLPVSIESLPSAGNIVRLLPGVLLAGDFQVPPFNLSDDQVLGITRVMPSASDETLSLYYQLSNLLSVYNDVSPDAKKEELRQKGFDAFTSGDYKEAIRAWEAWSKNDPRNAEPHSLIGDAWLRLNDQQKALEAYSQSLEINPGQMNLAIRHSRLLEQLNRLNESADILNVYARAFPDSPAVTIAQAQWLDRYRQRNEARELMKTLVKRHPDNIEARLVLQTMLDEPVERYANMQELLAIGRGAETHLFGFGRDIFGAELLTIPEASVFFNFVRETAANASNKKTCDLYQSFLPLSQKVTENFVADKLSDNWIAFGGFRPSAYGRYELRASTDMSEAFLRLKKSELMRDGFLEVTLDESAGAFWLYARRSSKSMIRYGYDDEGFIRIQSWFNGEIRTYESRPWLRPPGTVTLRLEVRGDGAVGYVNGKPVFTTPLAIPLDVCYGWWSVAPFSPELGLARARIARIECGPLAPTVLFIPRMIDADMRAALDLVRLHVRDMTAVAPFAFTQLPDGTVPLDPDIELAPFKMFCTFHRLRLMPVVDLAYFSNTLPEHLSNIILRHRLTGLILRVRTLPDADWFSRMEKMLEKTIADFVVVQQEDAYWPVPETDGQMDAAQEAARLKKLAQAEVYEIQRGSLLLHPMKDAWKVPAQPYVEWTQSLVRTNRESITPGLVIMPRGFLPLLKAELENADKVSYTQVSVPSELKPPAVEPVVQPVTNQLEAGESATNRSVSVDVSTNRVVQAGSGTNGVIEAVKENASTNRMTVLEGQVSNMVSQAAASVGVGTNGVVPAVSKEGGVPPRETLWHKLRSKMGSGEQMKETVPEAKTEPLLK